ncbi:MAG: helix-turn-helix transcriptional regulator [Lachnospiraceae bacterium]|nr:helix-turn-helix transcriptional regulator [Lachnospiraceae bacterium]
MDNNFNENIRRIRKEKGITQEQLADAVGVSAQAVSKWEISSFPDAGLLPMIADALGVKIDELFGRGEKELTMNQQVTEYMKKTPKKDRIKSAFDICRAIIVGSCGNNEYVPLTEQILKATDWEQHSQIEFESGWMQARNNENLQYFILIPEPEKGYDDVLRYDERQVEFLRFLSSPDALRAMYYMGEGNGYRFFSKDALISELGITSQRAEEIINGLLNFKLITKAMLQEGNGEETIYRNNACGVFISFLLTLRTMLNLPYSYCFQWNDRESAYLKNQTYKKHNDDK